MSGEVYRTPDLILSDGESVDNAKLNRVGGGTYRVGSGAITSRELSAAITGGFDTVSALRANTDSQSDLTRISVKGYYNAEDTGFEPDLIVDANDSSTADNGLSCFVDSNGVRYKREFRGPINAAWGGVTADGSTDDTTRLQAVIDYAETSVVSHSPNEVITAQVVLPAGRIKIASGNSIDLYRGIHLIGQGVSSTVIIHGGGSVPCLQANTDSNNSQLQLRDFSIYGAGSTTTYGILIADAYYDSEIANVTVNNCNDNIRITGSWTFKMDRVNSNNAIQDCMSALNWTAGIAVGCRFDDAGRYGCFVERDDSTPNDNVNTRFISCYFQRAGDNGFYGSDLNSAHFSGCWFEGNNKDNSSHADVKLEDSLSKGQRFSFENCYVSGTGAGGSGMSFVDVEYAWVVNFISCHGYNGSGNHDYMITGTVDVKQVNVFGCGQFEGSSGTFNLHADTRYTVIGSDTSEFLIRTSDFGTDRATFDTKNNMQHLINAPTDKRCEYVLSDAHISTGKWFIGRGDSDESCNDHFYIATTSGGGAQPALSIDESSNEVGINLNLSTGSATGLLDVNGNDIRIRVSQTPASAGAAGNEGEVCWDTDYIYVCTATNTWKRSAISTW